MATRRSLLAGRDIITSSIFDRGLLDYVLDRSGHFVQLLRNKQVPRVLEGKVMVNVFMEPSTRTSGSFQTAMARLGGSTVPFDSEHSSAKKGETLEDMMKVVDNYADVIVLRHPVIGSAAIAAQAANAPVISAGDGAGEHPSQALLDLVTISQELKRVDDLNIVLLGDLLYGRTVHSLLNLFPLLKNVNVTLVSPTALKVPAKSLAPLQGKVNYVETDKLSDDLLSKTDVLYVTRVQRERFETQAAYDAVAHQFLLNRKSLAKLKSSAIIMHPLPRVNEMHTDIDSLPNACYFKQPFYGVATRMTLLASVLGL
eukprot:comp17917_c0_seq1/m.31094 comp17917_c0_seq1/g.31094  ORF comp17917_c0_seq1/g.31094 comp17917_c0_seq1/m.31094 type:complete len:313 (+) comp17917_c0_seq1:34-972(+)